MATTAPHRVSSADTLALLSATDDKGRVDPVAFEAQRLIFANEKIGAVDARGLMNSMVSASSYSPDTKDTMIEAITQRLDKNDARRFNAVLKDAGMLDNPVEAVARDINQKLGKGFDEFTQGANRLMQTASDGYGMARQLADNASRDPNNNVVERAFARGATGVVDGLQFKYGELTGAGKHAINVIGETVDVAKMAHRFATDENYRDVLIGTAKVYAAETLRDPSKPYNDAILKASEAMETWEKGLQTAKTQGKQAQYLGESGGVVGIETLAMLVPVPKLGKFGKVANALGEVTPGNVGALNEVIEHATHRLDKKLDVPHKGPDIIDGPKAPDTSPDIADRMERSGRVQELKGATRMARHEGVLEDVIVRAKPGEVDAMLRQGSFTPQELGQMVRSEKLALGEKLFQNVSFNDALDATTKGVDIPNLSKRHAGDIAEAIMTHKWVKEGYTDIHSIKNNSEWGSDLVGRRPGDKELEFMEVKGSAHGKAKSQTGDPQSKVRDWLDDAAEGKKHWDPEHTQPGVQDVARRFGNEVRGGDINATWAKVNLKRDPKTGDLDHDAVLEKWLSPDERKAIKTQSKGGNASKPDGDEAPDQTPSKKSAELSPKDSLGLETLLAAVRKDGRWDEEHSKNIAAASLLGHVSDSLQQRVDSVRINEKGNVFSTYSPFGDKGPHLHSHVNGNDVAHMPAEQSLNQVAQVRQQQEAQVLALQQTQDPNTPKGPKIT
jgi:hypothetical protein